MDFFEGKWFPVFKTGKHTDSNGNKKEWTDSDLTLMAVTYNQGKHEAPVVIGHPKNNDPAYGWVDKLKKDGDTLFAKTRDLVPEFVELVKKGLYKKRSISLYGDNTLRHLGFLGGVPPAVKGLKDIQFSDGKETTIEFEEFAHDSFKDVTIARVIQKIRDYLIEKEGAEKADLIVSKFDVEELLRVEVEVPVAASTETFSEGKDMPNTIVDNKAPVSYTEAQTQAKVNEAVKARETEYAEAALEKDNEFSEREAALKVQEAKARKLEVNAFCESLKGKVTGAMLKTGLKEFLEGLLSSEVIVEFGEGTGTKKVSQYEFMKNLLTALPAQINFNEVANDGNDISGEGDDKKDALVRKYQETHEGTTYGDALKVVSAQNKELFRT